MVSFNSAVFCIELLSSSKVFQAVLEHGVGQWFSFGLEMGFTGSQIETCTSDKPLHGSKLQAIIELKVRECGVRETEKCLLTACERIPQPIVGSVLEYIERGLSHQSVEGEYCGFVIVMALVLFTCCAAFRYWLCCQR